MNRNEDADHNERFEGLFEGFGPGGTFGHGNAAFYAGVTFAAYAITGVLGVPHLAEEDAVPHVPALSYVLLLFIVLGWVLPLASFVLDKYRIPPELALFALVAIGYQWADTDHYYPAGRLQGGATFEASSVQRCVEKLPPDLPIVVVAASGGGVTASQWAATVLAGLHGNANLGEPFARSIRLISATSGGSVGTMYYVDTFAVDPSANVLRRAREAAGVSSLAAMGWGLMYPDLARVLLAPLQLYDRGWALETRWSQRLSPETTGRARTKEAMPQLSQWHAAALEGTKPAIAFNATLVETGEPMLISSLDCLGGTRQGKRGFRRFRELYPTRDIPIATAARLSATFPWVTPVARPEDAESSEATGRPAAGARAGDGGQAEPQERLYHVGDGGYYDNFGVLTAIRYIDALLEAGALHSVVLVEIRASETNPKPAEPRLDSGFQFEVLGPAEAMYAARAASQHARNELELKLLRDKWGEESVARVEFELEPKFPLSWHLSNPERRSIIEYWDDPRIRAEVDALVSHWESARERTKSRNTAKGRSVPAKP